MTDSKFAVVLSPTAIVFAQLWSFAQDLEEARDALERARSLGPDRSVDENTLWNHLVSAGVIAYWRCFPTRVGKPSLDGQIALTDEQNLTHELSRRWRNRVVAHTDTVTKASVTVIHMTKHDGRIVADPPFGLASEKHVPDGVVDRFAALVDTVDEQVEALRDECGQRLAGELSQDDLQALWEQPSMNGEPDESIWKWDPAG
jgi:hypothetical protein